MRCSRTWHNLQCHTQIY